MLKKTTTIIVLSVILSALMPLVMVGKDYMAYAASISVDDAILQPDDLGIEEPSILPTNPFYFLKKWQQDVRLLFTFNKLKKIRGVLDYTLEKSLELQKVTISAPQNTSAIIKASNNLADGIDSLQSYTNDFQSSEGFSSSAAQKFLSAELYKGLKLKKFFDQVDKDKISLSAKKNMQKTEDKLTKTMIFVPLNFIITDSNQDLIMSKARDIVSSLDNAEKLELVIVLDEFSSVYPNSRDAALLIKSESIKNLEDNLSKMSSGEFNKFVELNQGIVTLSAQGVDIVKSFSKLPAKSNLNKFVVVLDNNLVKGAALKFDSSTSTDFIEGALKDLMANDFYMETGIFYRALQSASSTPEFLISLQNLFAKNQEDFLTSLNVLQKDLITKSINLDTWPKNKINIATSDSEKYFIQANDLHNQSEDVDAIVVLYQAQKKIKSVASLVKGMKNSQQGDNSLCDIDFLNIEGFCLKIGGSFTANNECSALSNCQVAQPQEKAQDVSDEPALPSINDLSDDKDAQIKEIIKNPEAEEKITQGSKTNGCSEKEVECPSLSKKCADSLILQYGGGCAATFEQCNINEPTCLENK